MIRTWAGALPDWVDKFEVHVAHLLKHGWHFVIFNYATEELLELFKARVKETLGIDVTVKLGDRKICEFDPALGLIFPELVSHFDFWGHFNLDCVYGRLNKWLPEELLKKLDVFGNDPGAACGPLTLYRNKPVVNELFKQCEEWEQIFTSEEFHGFDEGPFSKLLVKSAIFHDIKFVSANWQSHDKMPCHVPPDLKIDGDHRLIECGREEIMMFHFNESRKWPISEL